jgi:hypothetical protein
VKTLLFILAVGAAGIGIEQPARAQPGGWCAEYDFGGHASARNCGFATFQQCLADVRGVGGSCSPSPYYQRPYNQRYRPGYPY